jgi:hypothetical protein
MIVISLVTVALFALSASAFRPPAFCVGRVTAARARAIIVAHGDNDDSKNKWNSELKATVSELQFKLISDKIDRVDSKIDDVKIGLDRKMDDVKTGLDRKIDDVEIGLDRKLDRVERKIDDVKMGLDRKIDDVKIGLDRKIDRE